MTHPRSTPAPTATPPADLRTRRREQLRELAKTAVTFAFCAGFLTYGLAVMFLMPAGH